MAFFCAAISLAGAEPSRLPDAISIASHRKTVVVGSTLGALVSDRGKRFVWACPKGVGYVPPYQPPYAVHPSGAIFVSSHMGLAISRDGGCDFALAKGPLAGMYVDHAAIAKDGAVYAVTSTNSVENGLFRSDDAGRTFNFTALRSPIIYFKSILLRGEEILVSAYDSIGRGRTHLYRSTDRGRTFAEIPTTTPGESELIVLLVQSEVPQDLYATGILGEKPTLFRHRGPAAQQVALEPILTATELRGAVDTQAGLYVVADGVLKRSIDRGTTFHDVPTPVHPRCVAFEGGDIFVCADFRFDQALGARSSDEGKHWRLVGKGGLGALGAPKQCRARKSSVERECGPLWPGLSRQLGLRR